MQYGTHIHISPRRPARIAPTNGRSPIWRGRLPNCLWSGRSWCIGLVEQHYQRHPSASFARLRHVPPTSSSSSFWETLPHNLHSRLTEATRLHHTKEWRRGAQAPKVDLPCSASEFCLLLRRLYTAAGRGRSARRHNKPPRPPCLLCLCGSPHLHFAMMSGRLQSSSSLLTATASSSCSEHPLC